MQLLAGNLWEQPFRSPGRSWRLLGEVSVWFVSWPLAPAKPWEPRCVLELLAISLLAWPLLGHRVRRMLDASLVQAGSGVGADGHPSLRQQASGKFLNKLFLRLPRQPDNAEAENVELPKLSLPFRGKVSLLPPGTPAPRGARAIVCQSRPECQACSRGTCGPRPCLLRAGRACLQGSAARSSRCVPHEDAGGVERRGRFCRAAVAPRARGVFGNEPVGPAHGHTERSAVPSLVQCPCHSTCKAHESAGRTGAEVP
jgi:hypothetical protein